MIYIVYSSSRPGDYYFYHLPTNTWSGWAFGKRFKPLSKFPYSRTTGILLNSEADLARVVAQGSMLSYFNQLGTSIDEVRDNYPELFI